MQIRNDVPVGSRIGSVRASDADASPPGNTVRYDISAEESSERVREYFTVHPETGEITIQDQLTKELYDVYRLAIRAYDLGEPSLDATVLILVNVRQVGTFLIMHDSIRMRIRYMMNYMLLALYRLCLRTPRSFMRCYIV